jgi:hypothetical protein
VSSRITQRDRLRELLLAAHGGWIPLPQILELKISQFGARLLELRRLGYRIVNRTENVNGKKCSWYKLEPASTPDRHSEHQNISRAATGGSFPEFGVLGKEAGYPD